MRLILSILFISILNLAISQDTVDVAVDSVHRQIFLSNGVSGLQNWTPRITRSQKNLDMVRFVQSRFDIAIDSFHVPFDGYMTSRYGIRWNAMHAGVDVIIFASERKSARALGQQEAAAAKRGFGQCSLVPRRVTSAMPIFRNATDDTSSPTPVQ